MNMDARVILAVDEGTTGTRAALVDEHGAVSAIHYRRLAVTSPASGTVEQDAWQILHSTVEVIKAAVADARSAGQQIIALAIASQRATSVLWDSRTGRPLVPAMAWQDTRYSGDVARLGLEWDDRLVPATGRPAGVRSSYLWAARHLALTPEVRAARDANRLMFGSIDTWLLWHLSTGSTHVTSATNASASGGYILAEHRYYDAWLNAVGMPLDLLPTLVDDNQEVGITRADLVGVAVPIKAVIGDQHAALIGLGAIKTADATVVHGTGSFCDLILGHRPPPSTQYAATLALLAWRANGIPMYAVETYAPTTGSALGWMCDRGGWFDSPEQISRLAIEAIDSAGVTCIPALAGLRAPELSPTLRGSLSGISLSTTREQIAFAVLEGIAHSVADAMHCNAQVTTRETVNVRVGGGLAASDPLLQLQADLTGVPMERQAGADSATLRGAAFLAGSTGLLWQSLADATRLLRPDQVFMPAICADARAERRATWEIRLRAELGAARQSEGAIS
ncbi:MAG: FGGY family carbohydrate kinase [Antricoccus sp.]